MADGNFQDIIASDSDDSDFEGFEPVLPENGDIDLEIVDFNDIELDDADLQGIMNEIENEERNVFHNAYECEWLRNFDSQSGPNNIDEDSTPYDIFSKFFDNEVLVLLVEQTNLYYEQYLQSKGGLENLPPYARARSWKPVTVLEMKVFFAIILFQGMVRMPNYDMYWSTNKLIMNKSVYSYMTRDRFLNILSFLHAADNSHEPPRDDPNHDPGYKIARLSSLLVSKWKTFYHPRREIAVDETLVPYKGRTKLLQYIPSKPHKWGLKVWTLADSKSGYVWNWSLYTGQKEPDPNRGVAHQIVMKLCDPLLNLGHHLYCDNFFTSPALFEELADNQTGACGTLRVNRNGVPREVKMSKPAKGEPPMLSRDGRKLYVSWTDKRLVNLLTTVHSGSTYTKHVRSRFHQNFYRDVDHPKAIQLYTHFMGGVDLADQYTQQCVLLHRMLKWWKKLFLCNLLEVCVVNAKVIYKELPPNQNKHLKTENFRLSIVEGLLDGYEKPAKPFRRPSTNAPDRITARHFPSLNPKMISGGRRSNPDCEVCSNRSVKRHQTQFYCRDCEMPMCAYPCFERYHTLVNYKVNCTADLHK